MPATFEYIDFGGAPNCLQNTKTGGYPISPGAKSDSLANMISHYADIFGIATRETVRYSMILTYNARSSSRKIPL